MRSLAALTLCLFVAPPCLAGPKVPASVYNVADFGAVADGTTLSTRAIQKAIDAAAGGGTGWLPAGTYLSGTLWLKSHVTLHLEPGCTLLGSPHLADYPPKTPAIASRVNLYCSRSLVYAENLENIAIEELPAKYPEAIMFGNLPAYGFFCRHVENLRFRGLIHGCRPHRPLDTFLRLEGPATRDIALEGNSFTSVKHPLQKNP